MTTKYILLFVGSLTVLVQCSKPSLTPAPSVVVQVYYKSQTGDDLLNPKTQGALDVTNVNVFNLSETSGNQTSQLSSVTQETFCNQFLCGPDNSGQYSIQFYVRPTNSTIGAVIRFNTSAADTLSYEVYSAAPETGYLVKKISYKSKVLWENTTTTSAVITLIK